MQGAVTAFQTLRGETMIAFAKHDGSVSVYDRFTMQPIGAGSNQDSIRTLLDVGYQFPSRSEGNGEWDTCSWLYRVELISAVVDLVISPNSTAVAMMTNKGELTTRSMQSLLQLSDSAADEVYWERFTAALSLSFAVISVQVHDLSDAMLLLSQRDEKGRVSTAKSWSSVTDSISQSFTN